MTYKNITKAFKAARRASLVKVIDAWMESEVDVDLSGWGEQIGYVGEETGEYMADAALAVLFGLSEAQASAVEQGSLKE